MTRESTERCPNNQTFSVDKAPQHTYTSTIATTHPAPPPPPPSDRPTGSLARQRPSDAQQSLARRSPPSGVGALRALLGHLFKSAQLWREWHRPTDRLRRPTCPNIPRQNRFSWRPPTTRGAPGFHFQGGGGLGVDKAPQNWGGGFGKRVQSTGTINSGAEGATIFFKH